MLCLLYDNFIQRDKVTVQNQWITSTLHARRIAHSCGCYLIVCPNRLRRQHFDSVRA